MPRVILDTNVLVAALRSRNGASHMLISTLEQGGFDIAISVPLVVEYEDALLRQLGVAPAKRGAPIKRGEITEMLDSLCAVARHQTIFFLWRPLLSDPKDDMVVEVAVAAACDAIITHNVSDFVGADRFGLRIMTPAQFLLHLRGLP